MGKDAYVGAAFELGSLFNAEFVAQVRVLLGEVQGFLALQAFDVCRFREDVHAAKIAIFCIFAA